MMRPDMTARVQAQMSVNVSELAAAKWVFGLLDFDNDGKCIDMGASNSSSSSSSSSSSRSN
jgi:hypothetical protein